MREPRCIQSASIGKCIDRQIRQEALEHDDLVLVGEAYNGAAAVQAIAQSKSDKLLMDLNLLVVDGITAIRPIN